MQKPTKYQLFYVILLWIGENITSAIGFKLYDDVVRLIGSVTNPTQTVNQTSGIIGLVAIIISVVIGIVLVLYYTRKLRMKYREASIDVYTKSSGLDLNEFLKGAKKELNLFGITLETTC